MPFQLPKLLQSNLASREINKKPIDEPIVPIDAKTLHIHTKTAEIADIVEWGGGIM